MTRYHNVQKLTTAGLERVKRELQANLGLINPGSPAHVPIQAHMQAIDTELAERAGCRQASGDERTVTTKRPPGSPFPYCPAGREPEGEKPPARAGLDTARAGPETAQP